MKEPENINLIAKWAAGELSGEEKQSIEKKEGLKDLSLVLEDIGKWALPEFETSQKLAELKEKIAAKKQSEAKTIKLWAWIRIAAGILLVVGTYFGYRLVFPSEIMLATQTGEKLAHELPAGSMVTLDALSVLKYDKKGWKKSREINIQGQAFIEVTKGAAFMVATGHGTVSVTGTKFNVLSNPGQFEVFCYEGTVEVATENRIHTLHQHTGLKLVNKQIELIEKTGTSPGWVRGFTTYDLSKLPEVVEDLRKYYGIDLDLPLKYSQLEYSGMIVHDNLVSALEMVFAPMGISYRMVSGNKVILE